MNQKYTQVSQPQYNKNNNSRLSKRFYKIQLSKYNNRLSHKRILLFIKWRTHTPNFKINIVTANV